MSRRAIASGQSASIEPADPLAATLDDRLAAIERIYDALLRDRAPQAHRAGEARFAPEAVAIPGARFIDAMIHGLPIACALLDEDDRCIARNPSFVRAAADLGIAVRGKADVLAFRTPGAARPLAARAAGRPPIGRRAAPAHRDPDRGSVGHGPGGDPHPIDR